MADDKKSELAKVMTPKFRVSFPNVFHPKAVQEGQEPKYSIAMLFDNDADLSEMKRAAKKALVAKWGKNPPKNLRSPFRNGEEKKQFEGYDENVTFVTASSKQKPGLVDQNLKDIIDQEEFYAGCYARATLLAFPYDTMGNKGISFLLSNIQKLEEGEQISGKTKAADDFDAIASEDNDFEIGGDENESSSDDDDFEF